MKSLKNICTNAGGISVGTAGLIPEEIHVGIPEGISKSITKGVPSIITEGPPVRIAEGTSGEIAETPEYLESS